MNNSANKINETPIIFNLPGSDKNGGKKPSAYSESDNLSFSTAEEDCDHDIISDYIGHYGRWQFMWTFLLCLFQIPTTFHIFCLVFQAVEKDFWCEQPEHLKSIPVAIWRNLTQPKDGCQILDAPYSDLSYDNFTQFFENFNLSDTIKCKKFEFDSKLFGTTIRSEFDLICDRNTLMSTVEMCFLAGAALGSVCSGWISDQFGRRHTLMSFALIQATIGTILGFVTSLEVYMTLRVIIGFASMAVVVVSFVLVVEIVSGKWRTIIGILNILPVAIAYIMTAGVAYVTFDWRIMQFAITSPGIVLLSIWYHLPESPRWLLAKGRTEELKEMIEIAAKMNYRDLPTGFEKTLIPPTVNDNNIVSVLDLLSKDYLRTTLLMLVIWFAIILTYFGITLHMSHLGVNVYTDTIIAGTVEAIAICLSIIVVLKLGLRINLFFYMIVAGIACILTNFMPEGNSWLMLMLAMVVKYCVGACNAIIPTFTAYQYPTKMRNLGVGSGNLAAGVALIIVPYMWLLSHYQKLLPMTIMGIISIIGGFCLLVLNDKLSKKDDTKTIKSDFPRNNSTSSGLANVGFSAHESGFI